MLGNRLIKALRFITNHPLNSDRKLKSLTRYVLWQIGSRIVPGPVVVNFVNDTRLLVRPGMAGATGNLYAGLCEFYDMSFTLHFLKKNDVFIDVGANVGSYTVLAGGVARAKCLAIEPIPAIFVNLIDNINLNEIQGLVHTLNIGVGRKNSTLKFTSTLDVKNHVITCEDENVDTIRVPVKTLNSIVEKIEPQLIKIDVEGFENEVIAGAEDVLRKKSLLAVIMEMDNDRYGYDEALLHGKMIGYGFNSYSYSPFDRKIIPLIGQNRKSENTLYIRDVDQVVERIKTAPKFSVYGREI